MDGELRHVTLTIYPTNGLKKYVRGRVCKKYESKTASARKMRIYSCQYRALKTLFLNWFKLTLSLSISLANSLRNVKQFQFYYANSHQSQGGSWNKVLGWISFYFLYINSIFQNTILNLFLYLQKNDKLKKILISSKVQNSGGYGYLWYHYL